MSAPNDPNLCRICLQDAKNGRDIFKTYSGDLLVANLINILADVEATADDKLPTNICQACLETIEMFKDFRKLVMNSDALLRETLAVVKEPPTSENEDFQEEYLDEQASMVEFEVVEIESEVQSTPQSEEKDVIVQCCSCKEKFTSHAIRLHFEIDHPDLKIDAANQAPGRYACNMCAKQFREFANLYKHQRRFTNLIACPVCGKEVSRSLLKQHMDANHETQTCDVCHKVLQKSGLAEHKKKVHSNERFVCNVCHKAFANAIYLRRHMQTVHCPRDPTKLVECVHCKKGFVNHSVLRKHMRIHSGEKPYHCRFCEATFTHNTDHRRHMWTHIGSPYQCEVCQRSFDRPGKLQCHRLTCSGNTNKVFVE